MDSFKNVVIVSALLFVSGGVTAYAESPDDAVSCDAWTLDGVRAAMTLEEVEALFPPGSLETPEWGNKRKPLYTWDHHKSLYLPEEWLRVQCGDGDLNLDNLWAQFTDGQLTFYTIGQTFSDDLLRDASSSAHTQAPDRNLIARATELIESCLDQLKSVTTERLGQPGTESRSTNTGPFGQFFKTSTWTSEECDTQIVVGLFHQSGGRVAECCGRLGISISPLAKKKKKKDKK